MKKLIFIILLLFGTGVFFTSCGQQKDKSKEEVEAANAKLDSLKGSFNPSVIIQPSSSHWAIRATFDGAVYKIDTTYTSLRAGKLPYLTEENPALPFVVKYFDQAGKMIGQYGIENPTSLRSCEPGKEAVSAGLISTFEILLPATDAIRNVQIFTNGKEAKRFTVPPVKRPETETNANNRDSTLIKG